MATANDTSPPQPDRAPQREGGEQLAGLIERVTFFNEENGFAVLKVKARGHRELVTVVGSVASASPGEWVNAEGRWQMDRDHGRQFRASWLTSTAPTTRAGIEKYLASGMVRGVGPICARKLVERFGERIFDVIETASARLEQVEGIGPKRRHRIRQAWAEQKLVREVMVFLHSHGVSTSRAVRVHRTYGADAIEKVRADPYCLARDIPGIGFKTADQIAQRLGIPRDSLLRARAGLSHVLAEATGQGHCALPVERLRGEAGKLLEVDDGVIARALERTIASGELAPERIGGHELIFLPQLKRAEEGIARRIRALAAEPVSYPPIDFPKALAWCAMKTGKRLAPTQREALRHALTSRVLVITGGPGTGKTTLLQAVLLILRAKKVRCLLCAPTGRAAKRLAQATGMEAKTIHRLLEARPGEAGFALHEGHPLDGDLLVVDECSMVDVLLMHQLLRALPARASLLLVGDADQLPPVGPGSVLQDLIASGSVPVARLTEVFRQAAQSRIITNAHRINQGQMPERSPPGDTSDFYFVERMDSEAIISLLLDLVKTRIPERFGLDPIRDVQVLSPMNRGILGARELNLRLQDALNPPRNDQPSVEKFGWRFRVGDKVMQTENNYDKDVFNGDIGQVARVDPIEQEVTVRYDDEREVRYGYGELDEVALAYAVTVHKAQGSEFPAVVLPLGTSHYLLLRRNLVYTGVTRGRRLVVLLGQKRALAIAVQGQRTEPRFSGLLARLTSIGVTSHN